MNGKEEKKSRIPIYQHRPIRINSPPNRFIRTEERGTTLDDKVELSAIVEEQVQIGEKIDRLYEKVVRITNMLRNMINERDNEKR